MSIFVSMSEQVFRFKQFHVDQQGCAMKVGTDGVLLGAWTPLKPNERALDVGTGTGLIALMLAQREPTLQMDAIEMESPCAEQARQNFLNSPWASRLQVVTGDFRDFETNVKYDLIVSNPPYFVNSTRPPSGTRQQARHTDSLSPEQLITRAAALLSRTGRMALILPYGELDNVKLQATENNLHLARLTRVKGHEGAAYKRILAELTSYPAETVENELVIEEARHKYSAEYVALTRDFYLAM